MVAMRTTLRITLIIALVVGGCAGVSTPVKVGEVASPCLPQSAPAGVLSWSVAYASTEVARAQGGGGAPMVMVGYVAGYRAAVVGWYLGEPAYFDDHPADPGRPASVNERLVDASGALRAEPLGPCRWRSLAESAT